MEVKRFKLGPNPLTLGDQRLGEPAGNKNLAEYQWHPGNKKALAENLSTSANNRRLTALLKGWETRRKMREGEKVVTFRQKRDQIKRKRLRLKVTVAKEAREIQEIARQHAAAAMERLAQIVTSEFSQDSTAVQAAATILDRAYGKANQVNTNLNVSADGKPTEITAKQLDARVAETLKRVEALTGGTPKAPPSEKRSPDIRKLN